MRNATNENQGLAIKTLDESAAYLRDVLTIQPDNPILWQRLATLYLYQNVQIANEIVQDPRAEEAINKAIELAPKREEGYLALSQMRALRGDLSGAENILLQVINDFPTDTSARMQLVTIYRLQNRLEEAADMANEAIGLGYSFGSYGEINWLVNYYAENKQYDQAIALQRQAEKIEPNNIQVFIDLAKLYMVAGKFEEAENLLKGVINFDPTKKAEIQALIDMLPK